MKPSPNPPNNANADDDALDALFATARADSPDTARAEYGFETRLLARIAAERRQSGFFWRLPLSLRLSPGFAAIALLTTIWFLATPTDHQERAAQAAATMNAGTGSGGEEIDNWLLNEWFTEA